MSGAAVAGKLELYLNGVWVDFTPYLQLPVTITGGRDTAYNPTQPSTLACNLYNDSGNVTPDNPLSTFFPYLTENVPCRFNITAPTTPTLFAGTTLASDTFTGTDGSAWSATWTTGLTPTGGSALLASNAGRLTCGSTGGYSGTSRISRIANITSPTDVVWSSRVRFVGDEVYPVIYVRSTDTALDTQGGYYVALNALASSFNVGKGVAFSNTSFSGDLPWTFTTNTWYRIVFGVVGSLVKFQIWPDGGTQPSTWTYEAPSDVTISAAGPVGITVGVGAAASGRFDIDDVTIATAFPVPTYQVFYGFVDSLIPMFGDINAVSGTVQLAASDNLARVNRAALYSDWIQTQLNNVRNHLATFCEAWTFGPDATTGQLRNVGTGVGVRHDAILLTPGHGDTGSYTIGDTVDDRLLDGAMTLSPATSTSTSVVAQGTCPQMSWDGAPSQVTISLWFKMPTDATYPGDKKAAFAQLYDGSGNISCTLWWSNAGTALTVSDVNGTDQVTIDNSFFGSSFRDGGWHNIQFFQSSAGLGAGAVLDSTGVSGGVGLVVGNVDFTTVRKALLGGTLNANGKGDPRFCAPGIQVGPFTVLDYSVLITPSWSSTFGQPGYGVTIGNRIGDISGDLTAAGVIPSSIVVPTVNGGSGASVARVNTSGRMAGDVLAELADTVAGCLYVNPADGRLYFTTGPATRQPGVDLTIDIGADMGDPSKLQFKRGVDEVPTRVAVSSPGGDVLVIDIAAEATGAIRSSSLTTSAIDIPGATTAGAWQIGQAKGLRMRGVQLDLVTSPNNNWPVLAALRPFMRVRLTGLPTTHLGYSYIDGFATGWVITFDKDVATIDFECVPAGIEARADVARAGAGGTATLSAGITASATTLAIATTGAICATSSGEYPVDINLNGERITLTSAPGGATSPQTYTGVTRGVAPGVARAHLAGEPVEAWNVGLVSM